MYLAASITARGQTPHQNTLLGTLEIRRHALIDWHSLYTDDFMYQSRCWEGGCESYCCTGWSQVTRSFSFMEQGGGPLLPLFAGEYEFLKHSGLLQDTFEETHRCKTISLKNGAAFSIDMVTCKLGGVCSDHGWRPSICRLYPFAPAVTLEGEITGLEKMNLYDHFWEDLEATGPCTIVSMSPEASGGFQRLCKGLMQDPRNIFLFMARSLFVQSVVDSTREQQQLMTDATPGEFFSHWEKLYLLGKLFDKDQVNADLTALYEEFALRYGDPFSSPGSQCD